MFAARRLPPLVSRLSTRSIPNARKISMSSYDFVDMHGKLFPWFTGIGAVSGFVVGAFHIEPFAFIELHINHKRPSAGVFIESLFYTMIYGLAGAFLTLAHPMIVPVTFSAVAAGVHHLATRDDDEDKTK